MGRGSRQSALVEVDCGECEKALPSLVDLWTGCLFGRSISLPPSPPGADPYRTGNRSVEVRCVCLTYQSHFSLAAPPPPPNAPTFSEEGNIGSGSSSCLTVGCSGWAVHCRSVWSFRNHDTSAGLRGLWG